MDSSLQKSLIPGAYECGGLYTGEIKHALIRDYQNGPCGPQKSTARCKFPWVDLIFTFFDEFWEYHSNVTAECSLKPVKF